MPQEENQQGESRHIITLEQTRIALIQELKQHDTALAPIAEEIKELETSLSKETTELKYTDSTLREKKREATEKNPPWEKMLAESEANVKKLERGEDAGAVLDFGLIQAAWIVLNGGDLRTAHLEREKYRIGYFKSHMIDTTDIENKFQKLEEAIARLKNRYDKLSTDGTEIEQKRAYDVFTKYAVNEKALSSSYNLQEYAKNNGTSLDVTLEKLGKTSEAFTNGNLSRKDLDAALEWAKANRGNMDLSPEEKAFKQFINRQVIPHLGTYEIWASMVDDFHVTGTKERKPLELLKQKPVSLSGRQTEVLALPASTEKPAESAALVRKSHELANDALSNTLNTIIVESDASIAEKLIRAAGENERVLNTFEGLFAGIENKIDALVATADSNRARQHEIRESARATKAKNDLLDGKISYSEAELKALDKYLPKDKPKILRVIGQGAKRIFQTIIYAKSGGVLAAVGMAEGTVDLLSTGKGGLSKEGQLALRKELVDYLKSQKVDVAKHEKEIEEIAAQTAELLKSADYLKEISNDLNALKIRTAYVTRSLLRSAAHNASLLAETCEQHGIESLDAFIGSFEGETRNALRRFCFGIVNTNDMNVILEEANAITRKSNSPHERALKDFVEHIVKPDIDSYASKAAKVDVVSQANLLPYGSPLEHTRGIIRDDGNPNLQALIANEFGMSVVGVQDVKHYFDYHLHRHGDKRLYDAKLKDGKNIGESAPKRINVYPPAAIEEFVEGTKQWMTHGKQEIPKLGDLFLRACAYEYFMPQAVRTAGTDNVFSENPEAPAAYPMVNATVDKFIEQMSLGPIQKFREKVGERLDNVIAASFIDFFATLGAMHFEDKKISLSRRQLREAGNTEDYGPVFSSYTRKITTDAATRFELFMDIYRRNLEKQMQVSTEEDRALLEKHLAELSDPSKSLLTPKIIVPGSHQARLLAAYEDHTLDNITRHPKR